MARRLTLFIAGGIVLVSICVGEACLGRTSASAKIVFRELTFDGGTVYEGEKVQHTFHFTNKGSSPIQIQELLASCTCTAVMSSEGDIPPGGDGSVIVTVDTRELVGPVKGLVSVSVRGFGDRIKLLLTATSMAEFKPSVGVIELSGKSDAKDLVSILRIDFPFASVRPVSLRGVRITDPAFEAAITEQTPDYALVRVRRSIIGASGLSYGNLVVDTSSTNLPELRIPVRSRIGS